jgi:hypothetical protein
MALQVSPDCDVLLKLSTEQLGDLLLIAVNLQSWPVCRADRIIRHDQEHKRLLYADSSSSSGGGKCSTSTSDSSSSSSSSSVVQLAEHLLVTALIRSTVLGVLRSLVASTAAQQLRPQAVTKLLYLSIQLQPPLKRRRASWEGEEDYVPPETPKLAVLLELPGAQAIQADSLAWLVQLAVQRDHYGLAEQLLKAVPAADQLPSRVLCEALVSAGDAYELQLVRLLAGLESAQELAPGAAMWLMRQLLKSVWGDGLDNRLKVLRQMDLGSQLTGDELLQLLQFDLRDNYGRGVRDLVRLTPAAEQIDDLQGVAAFLQTIMVDN